MRTTVVTDTNSGITVEEGKKAGIYVLPMPVLIDGRDYLEGVDITHADLYKAFRAGRDVRTSQPAPGRMTDLWDTALKENDSLVYIPMSSGLSGSCATAIQFAREYGGRVQVADNHRISVTMNESVWDAKCLADQGFSAEEIRKRLEEDGHCSSIYIAVNSLEYLKKSGRVTAAGAAIATVMNIKPVLTIQGGKLDAFAKVRGMKSCWRRIVEAVANDIETRFSDVPKERLRIGGAGTFEQPETATKWCETLTEAFPDIDVYYIPLSCSIASHVGIDATGVGISCIEPERLS